VDKNFGLLSSMPAAISSGRAAEVTIAAATAFTTLMSGSFGLGTGDHLSNRGVEAFSDSSGHRQWEFRRLGRWGSQLLAGRGEVDAVRGLHGRVARDDRSPVDQVEVGPPGLGRDQCLVKPVPAGSGDRGPDDSAAPGDQHDLIDAGGEQGRIGRAVGPKRDHEGPVDIGGPLLQDADAGGRDPSDLAVQRHHPSGGREQARQGRRDATVSESPLTNTRGSVAVPSAALVIDDGLV
jgi:hypothetical protein